MSTLVTVRPVAPADFDKWLLLWQGYNLFYGRPSLPAEITQMTWSRLFDAYEPVHALVAERNPAVTDVPDPGNELVGLVHYLFHRSTIHIAPVCYLQDLFTTEAARGQGVGRALIAEVYDRARRAGSPRVYWQTHETNSTAMHLYDQVAERSGFVVYRHQV
jgi:GNAT superfamily N-acetyltransferase